MPILIDLADMPTQFWEGVDSTGSNIRFEHPIRAYELVHLDHINRTGELWVAVTITPVHDTYLHITTPEHITFPFEPDDSRGMWGVWADHAATYHLQTDTASTPSTDPITPTNPPLVHVPAQVTDGIILEDSAIQRIPAVGGTAVSFWVRTSSHDSAILSLSAGNATATVYVDDLGNIGATGRDPALLWDLSTETQVADSTWHHVVLTLDRPSQVVIDPYNPYVPGVHPPGTTVPISAPTAMIYVDGVKVAAVTTPALPTLGTLTLAGSAAPDDNPDSPDPNRCIPQWTHYASSEFDEIQVRVNNSAVPEDYYAVLHMNQADPRTFYTVA